MSVPLAFSALDKDTLMDNRRLILLVTFCFSLVMLWDSWVKYNQPKPVPGSASSTVAQQNAGVPSAPASAAQAAAAAPIASTAPAKRIAASTVVETDTIRAEISAQGGDIIRLELKKHGATGDSTKPFVLFDKGEHHEYFAQSGLIGKDLPNHNTLYTLPGAKFALADGQDSLTLKLVAPAVGGVQVNKLLTFHRNSYVIDVAHEIVNGGATPLAASAYFKLTRDDKPAEDSGRFGARTFTGPAFYTDAKKYDKVEFSEIAKGKAKLPDPAADGWVAMVQHYFVTAFLPSAGQRDFFVQDIGNGLYSAGVKLPVASVAPGAKTVLSVPLYAGPQEQDALKKLAPKLDLVVDYGWLTVIAAPLFWLLSFLHSLVRNWGWAIILMTVLIKLVFFPLSAASYRSMAKMKTLMPRMKRIQEQYADDRMKMNQQMMELYKKEKVNPMGGCWPMLIQMPVFLALYWVLLGAVEMRGAPWLGWIVDLSIKDPYFILPIIMGVTSLVQVKLNPAPADPVQAKVMTFMPIVFTVMMAWFPAGLVVYWVVNNLLSIGQQWYITRMLNASGVTTKA